MFQIENSTYMHMTQATKSIILRLGIALSGLVPSLCAHPGHETLPLPLESTAHYMFEPMHMLPVVGAGVIFVFAIRSIGRCRWPQRAAQK